VHSGTLRPQPFRHEVLGEVPGNTSTVHFGEEMDFETFR